jgi:hypothetical protein
MHIRVFLFFRFMFLFVVVIALMFALFATRLRRAKAASIRAASSTL